MWHVAWYVQFQVLNNLENAASLNNFLLREGFQSASKRKTRTSHLGKQNSTRFIEIRYTKLDKAVFSYLNSTADAMQIFRFDKTLRNLHMD